MRGICTDNHTNRRRGKPSFKVVGLCHEHHTDTRRSRSPSAGHAAVLSGIQIIPLSEVAAKDEFLNIKNVSRDDMMAAHRVPPQMMGIMPSNVGGFGDVEKASKVFVRNELIPLQHRISEINSWIGLNEELVKFTSYELD